MARKRKAQMPKTGAEADLLERMMPRIRQTTAFGDDNHEAIQAQIDVLRAEKTLDDFEQAADNIDAEEDMRGYEATTRLVSMASDAVQWANGDKGAERPSVGWEPLLEKEKA